MALPLAKNTVFMTIASVGQKVISFAYFTIVARALGVEQLGVYSFALFYSTLFSIFTDVGLTPVLTREAARDEGEVQKIFNRVLTLKIFTIAGAYGLALLAASLVNYSPEKIQLISIAGIIMALDAIHLTYFAVLRAFHDIRWEAIGMVASQALTMILGALALAFHLPIIALLIAYAFSSACMVVYSIFIVKKRTGICFRLRAIAQCFSEKSALRALLLHAMPFALAGIFTRMYSSLDAVLLERFAGDFAVGIYAVPYKIAFAFQFIPMALAASLYPKMSALFAKNPDGLPQLFLSAMKYLLVVAIPLAAGTILLARRIIDALYPSTYQSAAPVLMILIISIIFSYASFPIGSLLNSCNKQHLQTRAMGAAMVCNIVLNLLLIPRFGALGSAIAATASYAVLFGVGLWYARTSIIMPYATLGSILARIVLSTLVMTIIVATLKLFAPLIIVILVGILVYALCARLFGILRMQDVLQSFSSH